MRTSPRNGFTLVELLVALAVASILLGVGVPSFAGAIKNARLNAPWTELRSSLFLARSEAVKSSSIVAVCARDTDTACGDDWDNGWIVYRPADTASPATIGGGQILRVSDEVHEDIDLSATGSGDRTAGGASERDAIWYLATGEADWTNGFFVVCDDRGANEAVALNVALTGDVRSARDSSTGDVALDVFGREVTCP